MGTKLLEMEIVCRFLNVTSKSSSMMTPLRGFPTRSEEKYRGRSEKLLKRASEKGFLRFDCTRLPSGPTFLGRSAQKYL